MKIFEGKKAVVIGGSGAIGKSIAAMLCKNGARVLIQGKTASKLEKAAEYIKCNVVHIVIHLINISDKQRLDKIIVIVGNGKKCDYMKTSTGILVDDDKTNINQWIKAGHTGILLKSTSIPKPVTSERFHNPPYIPPVDNGII